MKKLNDKLDQNQSSLQKMILVAFGVALACTAALAFLSLKILGASVTSDHSVERSFQVRTTLHRLSTHLDDVQNNARGYTLSTDPIYLSPMRDAIRAIPLDIQELDGVIEPNTPQWDEFQKLIPNMNDFLRRASGTEAYRRTHNLQDAVQHFKSNHGLKWMNEMRSLIALIDLEETKMLKVRMDRRNSEYIQLQHLIAIAAVLTFLFLSISSWRILKYLDERKRMQQLLVESSKMAALGAMASSVAHEINNPLCIIRGKAQVLRVSTERDGADPRKVIQSSLKIEDTVVRIHKIVTGLLNFAHGGRGEALTDVSVNQLLDSTLELCRSRFAEHRIDLRVARSAEPLDVRCRPVELSQVLLNLLNNAFDAVQEPPQENPWVEIRVQDRRDRLSIAVLDSGPGVAPEYRSKIMEPFFSTKEYGKGSGLGLSVSKGIIEAYGGALTLRDDFDHTCFEMSLPK